MVEENINKKSEILALTLIFVQSQQLIQSQICKFHMLDLVVVSFNLGSKLKELKLLAYLHKLLIIPLFENIFSV